MQDKGIAIWRLFGLSVSYHALGWHQKQGMKTKLMNLDREVRKWQENGYTVSLVGVSAGASAVLNYYRDHPDIHRVILLCGKAHNMVAVSPDRLRQNPDFKESLDSVDAAVAALLADNCTKNILSIYSQLDVIVRPKESHVEGAHHKRSFAWSHASVIAFGILFQGPTIARFVRA
jgi:pimeloyl-ACP methyl ester carboxylesterase